MDDWPALDKWRSLRWWHEQHGARTVPLEIGVPGAPQWREAPLRLTDFIERYLAPSVLRDEAAAVAAGRSAAQGTGESVARHHEALQGDHTPCACLDALKVELQAEADRKSDGACCPSNADGKCPGNHRAASSSGSQGSAPVEQADGAVSARSSQQQAADAAANVDESETVAYLAQHRLFDQLPALCEDIREPNLTPAAGAYEACNAWVGTRGTVRPVHAAAVHAAPPSTHRAPRPRCPRSHTARLVHAASPHRCHLTLLAGTGSAHPAFRHRHSTATLIVTAVQQSHFLSDVH